MANLTVRDLMTENLLTVDAQDTALKLFDLMGDAHVRHVPVVDASGELVGLVSHRDLLRGTFAETAGLPVSNQRQRLEKISVRSIMVSDPEVADPDQSLSEAAGVMLENKFGCLPVVEGDALVGILTESDFVRWVSENG